MSTTLSRLALTALLALAGTAPALAQGAPAADDGSGLLVLFGIYLLAILLMLVEIFLIPGFGLAGFVSIAAMGFCGYQAFTLYGMTKGAIVTLVLFGLAAILVVVALKIFARTSAGREFVLSSSFDATTSGTSDRLDPDLWVGRIMTAVTDLRPGGKATVDEQTVDVYCETAFVKNGASVKVVKVEDNKLFVREVSK